MVNFLVLTDPGGGHIWSLDTAEKVTLIPKSRNEQIVDSRMSLILPNYSCHKNVAISQAQRSLSLLGAKPGVMPAFRLGRQGSGPMTGI